VKGKKIISRREFLKATGVTIAVTAGGGLISCAPAPETPTPTTAPAATPTLAPIATPTTVPAGKVIEPYQFMTMTATEDPGRFEISRMAVEAWQEFGLPAEMWPVASSLMDEYAWTSKKYHVYIVHHDPNTDRMDPDTWLYTYNHSSNAGETGLNIAGYQNPEYDALAEAQRSETDVAKRKEIVDQCQEWHYNAQPYHVFAHLHLAGVYNTDTFADPTMFVGHPIYNFWSLLSLRPLTDRKVLQIGIPRDFLTSNPMVAGNPEDFFWWLQLIYDTLAKHGPDGTAQPWAAQSIDAISPTEYEVTLREGMTWHDGKPVTAEDVAFTFTYCKEKEAPYFLSPLQGLEKAEVVGPNKVRFTLTEPFAAFIPNVLCQVTILPKHIWETIENPQEIANEKPIGSGPYKFEYWRPMEESKLSRFEDHFQPPAAEGLLHIVYGSLDSILGALEAGDLDTTTEYMTIAQAETLEPVPHIKIEKVVEFGVYGWYYNCRLEPFNDRIFRQAMSLTFPVEDIIEIALRGAADPGGSIIAPALEFWHNDNIPPFPYDPDKAREMLLQAGYTWDEQGRLCYPAPENDKRDIDTGPHLYS